MSGTEIQTRRAPGHLVWVAVPLAVLALWLVFRSDGPCDDEYIAWRYARNLLQSGTFSFDPNGAAVEGFTCPLWVLACAAALKIGVPLAGLSSAAALLGALGASWSALAAPGRRESGAWCALAIALSVPLAYHGSQGLGTSSAAALVAWWYVLLGREQGGLAGLLLGAATLLRPELLVLLPFHAWAARNARAWIGAVLLPASWLWVRHATFGEWLPNTFFAKQLPLAADLRYGASYLWQATLDTGIGLLLLLLVLARPKGRAARTALAGAIAVSAGVVWVGGDYMFLARFLVPLVPLVLLLCADALGEFEGKRRALVRLAWLALLALQLWPLARLREFRESQLFYEQRWIAIGKALGERAPAGWKLATSPIGAIGWYSRLPIVDMLGITNTGLRSVEPDLSIDLKGHQRHSAAWVLAQRPDGIVLGNGISPRGERSIEINAWEKELYLDPAFQRDYEVHQLPIPGQTSLLYWERREGTPLVDRSWPLPARWKKETLHFPLDFAPAIAQRGTEELRFMPGFFSAGAPDFWSYDFAWWLEDPPAFEPAALAAALREYFRGLALAVGKGKFQFDEQHFRAELALEQRGSERVLSGDVRSYDPFTTGEEIVLHVEARLVRCPRAGRNALLFLVSPRHKDDPVWGELRACAAGWRCPD